MLLRQKLRLVFTGGTAEEAAEEVGATGRPTVAWVKRFLGQKFRLVFTDGTVEEVRATGPTVAWIKGKLRAAEKKTYLQNVEEV